MADVTHSTAIYKPMPADFGYGADDTGTIHFDIAKDVHFTLANPRPYMKSDLLLEAEAMRKLADVATELAAKLERRAAEEMAGYAR
jgi:hypothetical protein